MQKSYFYNSRHEKEVDYLIHSPPKYGCVNKDFCFLFVNYNLKYVILYINIALPMILALYALWSLADSANVKTNI